MPPAVPHLASVPAVTDDTKQQLLNRRCPICKENYPSDFRVCPRHAIELIDATQAGSDEMIGSMLGGTYQIMRVIGEGGMGRVYEAKHHRLSKRRFAVKLMHRHHASHAELVTRFRREAETTAVIGHPHVVQVYDVAETDERVPYIIAEYLDGEDLGAMLERVGRVDEATSARIIRQVCQALEAAHEHGIVHRDMKPENIYLTGPIDDPCVKLLDFGIAKVEDPTKAMRTKTGLIMGTPAYMAPEQASATKVDLRADIYAVGAILYRMVTGRLPYDREEPAQTLSALLTEEPARPCDVAPDVSAAFELVIQRAMARNPKDRYASMAELEADLIAFDRNPRGSTQLATTRENPPVTTTPEHPNGAMASAHTVMMRTSREAKSARPWIVASAGFGVLSAYALLVQTIGTLVLLLRGSAAAVTPSEATLIAIGSLAGMATPVAWAARRVAQRTWNNSVQALALSRRLRATVTSGLLGYGASMLLAELALTFATPPFAAPSVPIRLACLTVSASIALVTWLWSGRST